MLQTALANMIVEKLWLQGLISDEQKQSICKRNINKIYS